MHRQTASCCVRHCDSYGSDVWRVCAVTDLPKDKAVGIAWLLPQASGDKELDVLSACLQTLNGAWEAAPGRGLYGHCVPICCCIMW